MLDTNFQLEPGLMTVHSLSPTSGSALKGPIMDTNNIYMEEFFAELLVSGDKLEAQP